MKKSKSSAHTTRQKPEEFDLHLQMKSAGENFFQSMFESHQAVMLLIDPNKGNIIDANHAAVKFYKYSKEELQNLNIQDINQLAPEEVKAEWTKALKDERNYFVFPHKLADGQIRQVEVYSSTFTFLGKPLLYSIIHDITEKKIAEEALQKSEEKFEIAFKMNPNAIVLSALETGTIFEANETFFDLTGLAKEEIIGRSSLKLDIYSNPADRDRMLEILKNEGCVKNFELNIRHRSGKISCVLASLEILETNLNKTILTTLQDITERKRLEDQQKKEHDLLNAIINNVPAMISVYDPGITEVQLNTEVERVTGWTTRDSQTKNIMELAYPDISYRQEIAEYMNSLAPGFKDIVMTCKDGTTKNTLWANVSIDDGRRIGIGIDITARKKAQEELLRSKNIITTALASMTDAVYISDARGNLIEFNEAFYTFYRANRDTLFSSDLKHYYSFYEFRNPDNSFVPAEERPIPRALRGEKVSKTEYTIFRKDTGETWVGSFSFSPILNSEGNITGAVVVARDVTDTKRVEKEREQLIKQLAHEKEALAESEEKYRIMGEAVDYGVWAADAEGRVTYLSESFCHLMGKSFTELRENGWHEHQVIDQSQEVMDLWMHSVKTGEPYEHEHRIISKTGEQKYILARARPIRNQQGYITSWAGIHLDITDRRNAIKKLEEQYQNVARINEVLEDFVHIAAHDLRSPIGNLISLNELISRNDDIQRKMELFRMSLPVTKRLQQTVDGLLEMVSLQMEEEIKAERIFFDELWHDIEDVLSSEMDGFKGDIHSEFHQAPSIIYGEMHLTSILKNLVSNSIKYSTGCIAPKITVRTTKSNGFILLEIHDNGIGIDLKKVINELFKPFRRFTNKAEGTGMGLYIVKNIVEKNGGYIHVESELEKGTSFYCYLKEYPEK